MLRGANVMQEQLSTTVHLEIFGSKDHPLRSVRKLLNRALARLSGRFDILHADSGRESISLERLLRAHLL